METVSTSMCQSGADPEGVARGMNGGAWGLGTVGAVGARIEAPRG